ncbi:oxidoreductase [Microlunatus endophyticus]|uniref:Oxidoreductase n=1 Tax=Microlunatus endophyticus TaxID=1716077 RepID=A0A917W366_9ACTN|nr:SDR family NAD(P)-dependent oxidoreductase [Microlunatus endophyticus]GGL58210.1 oxidoreductase [Microlunatus endophyticus]
MTSQSPSQTPTGTSNGTAVVTGASSGIGAATARRLAAEGFSVVCAARRTDRIEELAAGIGGRAVSCDVTDPQAVERLVAEAGEDVTLVINNAGGALGMEPVVEADLDAWQTMYAANVLGAAAVTKAFLPTLITNQGQVIFVTSTAADGGYEGGAGYCAAKAAERSIVQSLRLEIVDQPVRVSEVAPGMVHTEEFSLTRFHGDQERADTVYAGVAAPLVADDIADVIGWIATRPEHVNIDRITVRPRAQAAQHKVHREA